MADPWGGHGSKPAKKKGYFSKEAATERQRKRFEKGRPDPYFSIDATVDDLIRGKSGPPPKAPTQKQKDFRDYTPEEVETWKKTGKNPEK